MARWTVEMSPWRRRSLAIPPDSWSAWVRLAVWELGMGTLLYGALSFGTRLIVTAPDEPRRRAFTLRRRRASGWLARYVTLARAFRLLFHFAL